MTRISALAPACAVAVAIGVLGAAASAQSPSASSGAPTGSPPATSAQPSLPVGTGLSGSPSPAPTVFDTVVTSSSGAVTIGIPSGALPAGIDPGSIQIDEPSIADADPDSGLLAAFSLEPEGAVFATPVTVTFAIPASAGAAPEVFLVSGDDVAPLPAAVTMDLEGGQATVSVQVPHFSTIVALGQGLQAQISDPGDQIVGQPFDVTVTVTQGPNPDNVPPYQDPNNAFQEAILGASEFQHDWHDPQWELWPGKFTAHVGIDPVEATESRNALPIAPQATASQQFTCQQPGLVQVKYGTQIKDASGIWSAKDLELATRYFDCVAYAPTGPTPTPTAAPSLDFGAMIQLLNGTYTVTRTFEPNKCGLGTQAGQATLVTGADGITNHFTWQFVDDSPAPISRINYSGLINSDMSLSADQSTKAYHATMTGSAQDDTITFNEEIQLLSGKSCKGKTVRSAGTATKNPSP